MRKSVLFDLDGTLVVANDLHFEALNSALAFHGMPMISSEARYRYEGLPSMVKMERLGVPSGLRAGIQRFKHLRHLDLVNATVRPDRRLLAEIGQLYDDGYFLGVVTNEAAGPAHALLRCTGLWGYMGLVIHGDFGRKKPDPELYLKALTTLRYPKNPYCIAVEDNDIGEEAANRAGLRCLHVEGPQDITAKRIEEEVDACAYQFV